MNLETALERAWPIADTLTHRSLCVYALGRLAGRSPIAGLERRARSALDAQIAGGGPSSFIGPFTSALWLSIVVDFGPRTAIAAAAERVREWITVPAGARLEAISDIPCAGPGLTTSVAIASLASAIAAGELSSR